MLQKRGQKSVGHHWCKQARTWQIFCRNLGSAHHAFRESPSIPELLVQTDRSEVQSWAHSPWRIFSHKIMSCRAEGDFSPKSSGSAKFKHMCGVQRLVGTPSRLPKCYNSRSDARHRPRSGSGGSPSRRSRQPVPGQGRRVPAARVGLVERVAGLKSPGLHSRSTRTKRSSS